MRDKTEVHTHMRLSKVLHARLKSIAEKEGKSMTTVLDQALSDYEYLRSVRR